MCMKKTKKKLPPADVIPEHNYMGKGCKESDCSSNKSDMKINRENEYLETCSANDLSATKIPLNTFGVSLAGPIPDFRWVQCAQKLRSHKINVLHRKCFTKTFVEHRFFHNPPRKLCNRRAQRSEFSGFVHI